MTQDEGTTGLVIQGYICVSLIVLFTIYHSFRLYQAYREKNDSSTVFSPHIVTSVKSNVAVLAKSVSVSTMHDQTDTNNSNDNNSENINDVSKAPTAGITSVNALFVMQSADITDSKDLKIFRLVRYAHIFTYLTLIFFMLYNMLDAYSISFVNDIDNLDDICMIIYVFQTLLLLFGKVSLYIVFVLRLKIVYDYLIDKNTFSSLYVIIILYGISTFIGAMTMFGKNNGITWYVNDSGDNECDLDPNDILLILAAISFLTDVVIQVYYLVLFLRPLFIVLNQTSKSNNKNSNNDNDNGDNNNDNIIDSSKEEIPSIMIKYGILTCLTVITTMISLITFIFFDAQFIIIDNVFNSMTILLMSSIHDKIYNKLCCCCHNAFKKIFFKQQV